jgi:hypothetical protein
MLRAGRAAFTLAESLIAITIVGMTGAVLLLAVESTLQNTWDSVDRTIAEGMADQLLDEILAKRYMAEGESARQTPLGRNAYENGSLGRERYHDSDDYHGFVALPAEGVWGEPLGTGNDRGGQRHPAFRVPTSMFENWRQRVEVYYVNPTNHAIRLTGNNTSYFRAVEVHIEYVQPDGGVRSLATRKRVYAYLPPPS